MQIYRFMDIGTAKLKPEERLVKHHLLDIVDPGQSYSAQLFQEQARAAFRDIATRNKVPILSGGTGVLTSRLHSRTCVSLKASKMITHCGLIMKLFKLSREMRSCGMCSMKRILPRPSSIHPNNFKRVIRALEMHEEGVSYADQVKNIKSLPEVVPSIRFFLEVDPVHPRRSASMLV